MRAVNSVNVYISSLAGEGGGFGVPAVRRPSADPNTHLSLGGGVIVCFSLFLFFCHDHSTTSVQHHSCPPSPPLSSHPLCLFLCQYYPLPPPPAFVYYFLPGHAPFFNLTSLLPKLRFTWPISSPRPGHASHSTPASSAPAVAPPLFLAPPPLPLMTRVFRLSSGLFFF